MQAIHANIRRLIRTLLNLSMKNRMSRSSSRERFSLLFIFHCFSPDHLAYQELEMFLMNLFHLHIFFGHREK